MYGLKWAQMSMTCCAIAVFIVYGVLLAKKKGLIPEDLRGSYAVSCWSASHPELKKAGKDYELKSYTFVSCVVLDTRTGKVSDQFVPQIPGTK